MGRRLLRADRSGGRGEGAVAAGRAGEGLASSCIVGHHEPPSRRERRPPMTRDDRLTRARQDYLKAIYHLGGETGSVSTTQLAERLEVAPASVTEMLATLRTLDLVSYDRYRGASLTQQGAAAALQTIRRHRLIELFLVKMLGYQWDEVHEEAERLEHVISARMEQRIFEALGRPDLDPHGDPIPSA